MKLPETKSLPVIYSYICPDDSVIRLKLLASSPLYSSNQIDILSPLSDADVKISSDQGISQLIFNQNTGYYELKTNSYPIVPGQVYKMTVTTINGDVATAETQVPFTAVPINMVTVETIIENNQTSDRINVSFIDEPGRVNYYRIAVLHAFVLTFQTDTISDDTRINERYSDLNHDGENVSLVGRFYPRSDSTQYYSTEYYDVFLYNCSESYYKFYELLRTDLSGIGFPPPAEPTLMYSNVKGGFGCFGAYMKMKFRYKKK
ncbi:MAG: DUF4249 domain-containing protein [bacterium]|nr:DUF4249 domain-containing protein [bacterium]